jgi:hypothetical protein
MCSEAAEAARLRITAASVAKRRRRSPATRYGTDDVSSAVIKVLSLSSASEVDRLITSDAHKKSPEGRPLKIKLQID